MTGICRRFSMDRLGGLDFDAASTHAGTLARRHRRQYLQLSTFFDLGEFQNTAAPSRARNQPTDVEASRVVACARIDVVTSCRKEHASARTDCLTAILLVLDPRLGLVRFRTEVSFGLFSDSFASGQRRLRGSTPLPSLDQL